MDRDRALNILRKAVIVFVSIFIIASNVAIGTVLNSGQLYQPNAPYIDFSDSLENVSFRSLYQFDGEYALNYRDYELDEYFVFTSKNDLGKVSLGDLDADIILAHTDDFLFMSDFSVFSTELFRLTVLDFNTIETYTYTIEYESATNFGLFGGLEAFVTTDYLYIIYGEDDEENTNFYAIQVSLDEIGSSDLSTKEILIHSQPLSSRFYDIHFFVGSRIIFDGINLQFTTGNYTLTRTELPLNLDNINLDELDSTRVVQNCPGPCFLTYLDRIPTLRYLDNTDKIIPDHRFIPFGDFNALGEEGQRTVRATSLEGKFLSNNPRYIDDGHVFSVYSQDQVIDGEDIRFLTNYVTIENVLSGQIVNINGSQFFDPNQRLEIIGYQDNIFVGLVSEDNFFDKIRVVQIFPLRYEVLSFVLENGAVAIGIPNLAIIPLIWLLVRRKRLPAPDLYPKERMISE